MRNLTTLVLCLLITFFGTIQNADAQGLLYGKQEQKNISKADHVATGRKGSLPPSVNLRPYCPPPIHQGYIPSCVGFACSYAQTIQYAIHNQWTDTQNIGKSFFSPLFLYIKNRKKADCYSFVSLSKTLNFLKTVGNIKYENFEEVCVDPCPKTVNKNLLKEANQFKIEHYSAVFAHNTVPEIKLRNVKRSLADSLTVIVGLDNFLFDKESNGRGKHAVTFVAYDDDKKQFTFINSYGEEWGDNGFGHISYDDFLNDGLFAYQIHIKKAGREPIAMYGSFDIAYELPNSYKMKNGSATYRSNRYILQQAKEYHQTGWLVNQGFQLVAQNNLEDKFLYVFTLNPRNELTIHYSLKNKMESRTNQSAQQLYIPNKREVFYPEYAGKEYLCVLVSQTPLYQFEEQLAPAIQATQGNLQERLETIFGEQLIAKQDIQYHSGRMEFQARLKNKEATIVPLILEIEAN